MSNSAENPKRVICMKWGNKYGAEYVNRLYAMLGRTITGDFELVCFTDSSVGIRDEVNLRPLPELDLPCGLPERGWNKLAAMNKDLGGLQGPVLFLDLDVVITGNIDPLFTRAGRFLIIRDTKFRRKRVGNSSVFRFTIGEFADVLDHFVKNFDWVRTNFRNEQAYLSWAIDQRGALSFWPKEWCISFKYDCVKPWPMSYFFPPSLPNDARIVIFHGHPLPDEAVNGVTHNWYRPIRRTRWISKYWQS